MIVVCNIRIMTETGGDRLWMVVVFRSRGREHYGLNEDNNSKTLGKRGYAYEENSKTSRGCQT